MNKDYEFRIDGPFTPETLPMDRLATYMAELAQLMGEPAYVHFQGVRKGSAILAATVDEPARPKVGERLRSIRDGNGPPDASRAFRRLDELLRMDNAVGQLTEEGGSVLIPFPGRTRPQPLAYGPFKQDGAIDGQVFRVGGTDDTIHVHLRQGGITYTTLETKPDVARRIAQHLLGPVLRLHGTGTWFRAGDGSWDLRKFKITSFEVLDQNELLDVVHDIRRTTESGWSDVDDPSALLTELRGSEGPQH